MVETKPTWVIKSSRHRGQGVQVVSSKQLISVAAGEEADMIVQAALSRSDTILQTVFLSCSPLDPVR